jgi:hypothetical protein
MVPKLEVGPGDGLVTIVENNAGRFLDRADEFARRYVAGQEETDGTSNRYKAIAFQAAAGVLNQLLAILQAGRSGTAFIAKPPVENTYHKVG